MAEVKRIGEDSTAEFVSYGIPPKQSDGPKLVKGQEPEALDKVVAASEPMPLFSESEMGDLRIAEPKSPQSEPEKHDQEQKRQA